MSRSLQELLVTDEDRAEAAVMSRRYLRGAPVRRLSKKAKLSPTQTLYRIMAANGAESMKSPDVRRLKRTHRQNCTCHRVHHITQLTLKERKISTELCNKFRSGTQIRELAEEYGKTKDRIATIVAVGFGLRSSRAREFHLLKAEHRSEYLEMEGC